MSEKRTGKTDSQIGNFEGPLQGKLFLEVVFELFPRNALHELLGGLHRLQDVLYILTLAAHYTNPAYRVRDFRNIGIGAIG